MQGLYEQDKCNDVDDKAPLTEEQLDLNHTCSNRWNNTCRRRSLSFAYVTSSAARIRALAEAAAAWESAEYEKIIVKKEHAHKEHEAELKRNRKQEPV